jgi:rhomboid protease GluP
MLKKIHYNAPVTLTFAFLSLAVLLLGQITGNLTTRLLFSVGQGSPTDILFYVRLFGHVLGHSGWEHYISNFLLILLLGPLMEERYGSKTLLLMILGTALATGIVHVVLFDTTILGASGIVFMLIMLSAFVNTKEGRIPLTVLLVAAAYIGQEVYRGIFASDNISQFSHIAGGICGCIFGITVRGNRKRR